MGFGNIAQGIFQNFDCLFMAFNIIYGQIYFYSWVNLGLRPRHSAFDFHGFLTLRVLPVQDGVLPLEDGRIVYEPKVIDSYDNRSLVQVLEACRDEEGANALHFNF